MKEINILEQQQANEVLRLEIAYSNLYRAYISGNRTEMINFYTEAKQINIPNLENSIINESSKIFYTKSPFANLKTFPIERLTTEQLKWNIEGCLNALYKELCQRNIYKLITHMHKIFFISLITYLGKKKFYIKTHMDNN